MGNFCNKIKPNKSNFVNISFLEYLNKIKQKNDIKVAHYTPCIFPLVPIVNDKTYKLCNNSWHCIINKKSNDNISGISNFYNIFYKRLASFNEGNKIIILIENHSKGKNKITEKGNIIIRIMKFTLDKEKHTGSNFEKIKRIHYKVKIEQHMYSIFIETLIYTIVDNLEYKATHEIMEAWINLFAFIMKEFLK